MTLIPFIRKITTAYCERGRYNGYVLLPKGHPLFGKSCEKLDEKVSVHGGVTYSGPIIVKPHGQSLNSEFVHLDPIVQEAIFINPKDKEYIMFSITYGDPQDWWIVGWDTAHYGDTAERWTKEATIAETLDFCKQLEALV